MEGAEKFLFLAVRQQSTKQTGMPFVLRSHRGGVDVITAALIKRGEGVGRGWG